MSLRLSHTTWDALDPFAVAEFWRCLLYTSDAADE